MSRHTHQECSLPLFQIEIMDLSRKNGRALGAGVAGGATFRERIKYDDIIQTKLKTLTKRFKDYEAAIRWAGRIGSVVSCHKVDVSPYLNNIEHLNLRQQPIEITIDKQEFELDKDFVITRSGLTVGEIER